MAAASAVSEGAVRIACDFRHGLVEPAITRDPSGIELSLVHGQAHVIIALSEHSVRALALVLLTNVGDAAC
jgi:hypothetical protein